VPALRSRFGRFGYVLCVRLLARNLGRLGGILSVRRRRGSRRSGRGSGLEVREAGDDRFNPGNWDGREGSEQDLSDGFGGELTFGEQLDRRHQLLDLRAVERQFGGRSAIARQSANVRAEGRTLRRLGLRLSVDDGSRRRSARDGKAEAL